MKRNVIIALIALLPLGAWAQNNTWEKANVVKTYSKKDPRYLKGAVPEVNGKVVFSKTIKAPGKSAADIFAIVQQYMGDMISEENQIDSHILGQDNNKYQIAGNYQEWLVFKSTKLELDRTRFLYDMQAKCENGQVKVSITHIHYIYDEFRKPIHYQAEKWITDNEALNKKGTRLLPVSAKFRRKTIDRVDYLFNKIESLLK